MQSIEEINKELEEVRDKWSELLDKRNTLVAKNLNNKYYEITSFGSVYVIYFHCEDFIIDYGTITLQGEKFEIDNNLHSYHQYDNIKYDYCPTVCSYVFKEITEKEYNKIKNKYIK